MKAGFIFQFRVFIRKSGDGFSNSGIERPGFTKRRNKRVTASHLAAQWSPVRCDWCSHGNLGYASTALQ